MRTLESGSLWRLSVLLAFTLSVGISANAWATNLSNGGFELGNAVQTANNATDWTFTPSVNGERVNTLTNNVADIGNGASGGTQLINPLFGNWFGYAENGGTGTPATGQISQSVLVTADQPILTFWWQFFTNETPGAQNTFNDLFYVQANGGNAGIVTSPPIATVNATGPSMISTNGPLFTPVGGALVPGQNQSFGLYTPSWSFASLNLSADIGSTVTVLFRVDDSGGGHNQSSGFALDNIQFVAAPEPASMVILGIGLVGLVGYGIRRRLRAA